MSENIKYTTRVIRRGRGRGMYDSDKGRDLCVCATCLKFRPERAALKAEQIRETRVALEPYVPRGKR